jgi:hypothetical protein
MIETILSLKDLPPTLNEIIGSARQNRFASAVLKKKWTKLIADASREQGVIRVKGEVYLEYVWRVKNRRRDQDNITAAQKYILDGLVLAQIIEEDNLKIVLTPVIHHVVVTDHDGFSVIIRNREALLFRLTTDLLLIPEIDLTNIKSGRKPTSRKSGSKPSKPRARRSMPENAKIICL